MPTVNRKSKATFRLSEGIRLALAKLLRKLGLIGDVAPSDAAMVKLVDDFCRPPKFGPRGVTLADDQGKIVTTSSEPREDLDKDIPF